MIHLDSLLQNSTFLRHSGKLNQSFHRYTGQHLVPKTGTEEDIARSLYKAPLVVLSHNFNHDDVIFDYANEAAQKLWEYSWEEFIQLPSRLSAEADSVEARQKALSQAEQNGYISGYSGIRISKSGKRFRIQDVVIWNLEDENGRKTGQAACFPTWTFL